MNNILNQRKDLLTIVEKGTFYYPAYKHYGRITNVNCDFCSKSNLDCCLGFLDKDLCLRCVELFVDNDKNKYSQLADLYKPALETQSQSQTKKKINPSFLTRMQQDSVRPQIITNMMQDSVKTYMMQDTVRTKMMQDSVRPMKNIFGPNTPYANTPYTNTQYANVEYANTKNYDDNDTCTFMMQSSVRRNGLFDDNADY